MTLFLRITWLPRKPHAEIHSTPRPALWQSLTGEATIVRGRMLAYDRRAGMNPGVT
jgi:hypothetical protein